MAFLRLLDSTPILYRATCWLIYALFLAYLAAPFFSRLRTPRWLQSDVVFGLAMALVLLTFRWPPLFYPDELNADETLFIAGARRLVEHPVFWRDFEGGTSGPLNFYILLPLQWLCGEINYFGIRCLSLLLVWGQLFFQYLICRQLFDKNLSRMAMLPAISFFAFTFFWDFLHYSSEDVSALLLSLAGYLAVSAFTQIPRLRPYWLAGAGLALGMIPLAKSQGLPLACIGYLLIAIALHWNRPKESAPSPLKSGLWLTGGFIVFPMVVLLLVLALGAWPSFYFSYVTSNLSYSQARTTSPFRLLFYFFDYAGNAKGLVPYLSGTLLFLFFCVGLRARSLRLPMPSLLKALLLVNLVSIFTIIYPGRSHYYHYLLWLGSTLGLFVAVLFGGTWQWVSSQNPADQSRLRRFIVILFLATCLLPQIVVRAASFNPMEGSLTGTQKVVFGSLPPPNPQQYKSPWNAWIARTLQPGETMIQWGWANSYFIHSKAPYGSPSIYSATEILDGPSRDAFRERYLASFKTANCVIFIDTVGQQSLGFIDRKTQGHEIFPDLARYIRENYTLYADDEGVRFYVRNDRYRTLKARE